MTNEETLPTSVDVAILGGGCAGMSLAYRLLLGKFRGSVLILEQSKEFDREQRWCSWGPLDPEIRCFVSKSWDRFVVGGSTGMVNKPAAVKYLQIYAPHFLGAIAQKLNASEQFQLIMGVSVGKLSPNDAERRWSIATDIGSVNAAQVFDARNLRGYIPPPDSSEPWLHQSFAGVNATADTDVFETDTVTLMDFAVPGGESGAFIYVLPYSKRSALIESTLISVNQETTDEHLSRTDWYIQNKVSAKVSIESIETGLIPMTTTRFPFKTAPGRYYIGTLGGAAKPSTGYAFSRIQRQTKRIAAEMIKFGRPLEVRQSSTDQRREWIDDVFLTASATNDRFFTKTAVKMAEKLPPDLLIRFLSENNSLSDDLKVMSVVGNKELADAAGLLASKRK